MGGPSQSSVGAHGSQGSSAIQQWHPGVYTTLANLPSEFTVDFGQSRLITAFSTHANRSHLPATAQRVNAFVDTMATLIVVNSVSFLKTVTQHSPGYSADTINGPVPIDAIGTIDMWIEFTDDAGNKSWRLHSDIPNVIACTAPGNRAECLYSTRVFEQLYDYDHKFKTDCYIVGENSRAHFQDDGTTYTLRCAISTWNDGSRLASKPRAHQVVVGQHLSPRMLPSSLRK